MPTNLLIFPLLGGYYFISRSRMHKYHFQRHDGQRLLLEASLAGALFLFLAVLIEIIFQRIGWCPTGKHLEQAIGEWISDTDFEKFEYLGINLLALGFGVFFGEITRLFISTQKAILKAIEKNEDELELLIKKSWYSTYPKNVKNKGVISLAITLKSGKVYIGYANALPVPSKTNYVSLLPLFSGYRDSKTHEMIFTTQYVDIYAEIIKEKRSLGIPEFLVLLPVSEFISVNIFDIKIYKQFQARSKRDMAK